MTLESCIFIELNSTITVVSLYHVTEAMQILFIIADRYI